MTTDERLREAYYAADGKGLIRFKRELERRGLAVVELKNVDRWRELAKQYDEASADLVKVSKGEPSVDVISPCSESVSRGDVPTGNEGRQTAHPCSLVDGSTEIELNGQNSTSTLVQRNATLEAGLRDAIHQLATRNGYIVTDRPEYAFAQSGPQALIVQPGLYWRDDTTDAVKRLQEALHGESVATGHTEPL